MRNERRAARAWISAGSTASLRWSNGILSRKKKVSLVVIASTTSDVSGSAPPPFIFWTSSGMPGRFDLRAQRHQAALDQILLIGGKIEPGTLLQEPAQV